MELPYFPDVKASTVFSPETTHPTTLYADERMKVIVVAMTAGQAIPLHPEGLAAYVFLEGTGWMTVNGRRVAVAPGAVIITKDGSTRGIEAEKQLVFVTMRLAESLR